LNDESGESKVLGKNKLILLLGIAFLFIPFSFAAEGCSDLFRFDYASSAVMPILGQDVSPGGSVVAVRSLKPVAFYLGENGYAEYFFVALQDQYNGGKKLMSAGDVFFRFENETGSNNTYFRPATQKPVYAETGDVIEIDYNPDYAFSYAGRSYTTSALRIFVSKPDAFGAGFGTGESVIVLAETLDPLTQGFTKGSIFLESGSGLIFVLDGRIRFVSTCIPSCSDKDSVDYYYNSTCKSTLTDGTDYCLSATELTEFTCSPQNSCVPKQFSCPFGCADGKCVSGAKATCDDSDGLNIAQRGRTSGNYANGSKFSFLDSCVGSTKLVEYSCTGDKVLKSQTVECAGGSCEDGACVAIPTVAECSDTDGGRNYEVAGVCADSSGSYADSCSQNSVVEYYCDAGYCKTIVSPCSSCVKNACSKESLVPSSNTGLFLGAIVLLALAVIAWLKLRGKPKHKGL